MLLAVVLQVAAQGVVVLQVAVVLQVVVQVAVAIQVRLLAQQVAALVEAAARAQRMGLQALLLLVVVVAMSR